MSDEQNTGCNVDEGEIGPPLIPKPPNRSRTFPKNNSGSCSSILGKSFTLRKQPDICRPQVCSLHTVPEVQDIIVDEFAQSGRHRRTLEEQVFDASIQRAKRGMCLGFVLAISLIICGTMVILSGYSVEGLAVIAADAGVLAVAYIVDHRSRED